MPFPSLFATWGQGYFLHGVALEQCVAMLVMLPIEIVALGYLLLDLCLDLEDILLQQAPGSGLVLLPEHADVVAPLESTSPRR